MERKSKGPGYKMKGHTLPGINQKSEGNTDMPDGRSGSSPLQAPSTYRAPQGNKQLIEGHGQTAKTTGGSVFSQVVANMSDNFKETKDKVVDATLSAATGAVSDKRLKYDINLTGKSPSGLNIYSFKYKDTSWGEGTYQGVMSDEIPQEAVIVMSNGYDAVDYSMLDVEFKQI